MVPAASAAAMRACAVSAGSTGSVDPVGAAAGVVPGADGLDGGAADGLDGGAAEQAAISSVSETAVAAKPDRLGSPIGARQSVAASE